MNDHPRSHIERRMLLTVGIWYAGSSITKGAGSPANIFVFLSMIPDTMIAAIPRKYALGPTHHAPPKSATAIMEMMGSLAPQGMNVVVMMVIRRSRSFSMVRDDMIPGTPQPVPMRIGIKDLPERPKRRNILSMMNATLAMYPQDSRIARKMKSTSIWGTNPRTAPTPATIPSRIRLLSQSPQWIASRPFSTSTGTPGTHVP